MQIEESYGTLQEEVAGLNKKLKKVSLVMLRDGLLNSDFRFTFQWQVFNYMVAAKSELSDSQSEYGQLREDLLDTIRATHKEIKLANVIIGQHIPGAQRASASHCHLLWLASLDRELTIPSSPQSPSST